MRIQTVIALFFFGLATSFTAAANECTDACDSEYKGCKEVAESTTAKQACEDDVKACKADCK